MTIKQCNGNWNYMYEWRISKESDVWFPCHVLDKKSPFDNYIYIFTRNGSVIAEPAENVRKMSKENYISYRKSTLEILKNHYRQKGFLSSEEEDVALWASLNDKLISE